MFWIWAKANLVRNTDIKKAEKNLTDRILIFINATDFTVQGFTGICFIKILLISLILLADMIYFTVQGFKGICFIKVLLI